MSDKPGLIGGPLCGQTLEKMDPDAPELPDNITLEGIGTYTKLKVPPNWMVINEVKPGFCVYLWKLIYHDLEAVE